MMVMPIVFICSQLALLASLLARGVRVVLNGRVVCKKIPVPGWWAA